MGGIKVFLIVFACMKPDYTYCKQVHSSEMPDPETCQLNRPAAVSIVQTKLNEGWLSFSKCEFVNTEKNGRKG